MKYFNIFVLALLTYSCVDNQIFPIFPKTYSRINNIAGKDLILNYKKKLGGNIITYAIYNKGNIEFKTEQRYSAKTFDEGTIEVVFDDGKKFEFKNFEYDTTKNFLSGGIPETPSSGKYKNGIITHYYIKPKHYELAK